MIQNDRRPATPLTLSDLPGPDTATKRAALNFPDPRFRHMLYEAAKIGWPDAYADDLYRHDMEMLKRFPGEQMLWILREHGTHLYPLDCDNAHEATYYRQVIDYWSGDHKLNTAQRESDRARYYVVRDEGLVPCTANEARARIKVTTRN